MPRPHLLFVFAAPALVSGALGLLVACSGSSSPQSSASEAGSDAASDATADASPDVTEDVSPEASSGDALAEGSALDAGASDGGGDEAAASCVDGATPPGTLLVASATAQLAGVTSDGYVITSDGATVLATPLAGGAATMVTNHLGASPTVWVFGNTVVMWLDVMRVPSTGRQYSILGVWSAANGYHETPGPGVFQDVAVSPDGSSILYTAGISTSDGRFGNVVGSSTTLASPATLATNVYLDPGAVLLTYVGSGPGTALVGTGTGTGPLLSVDPATWKTTLLSSSVVPYLTTGVATAVFTVDDNYVGSVIPIGGGTPVPIDTHVYWGLLSADGSQVGYALQNGTFKRAPSDGGAGVTLVASPDAGLGVSGYFTGGYSPDGRYLLTFRNLNSQGGGSDLYLVDMTVANQTPLLLDPQTNGWVGAWTADSAYLAFWTQFEGVSGTLNVVRPGSGAQVGATFPNASNMFPLGSTDTIAFSVPASSDAGSDAATTTTPNLQVEDLSAATPTATPVVSGTSFGESPDGKSIVYVTAVCPPGVYVVPVP
jgi:hypothetical protein